MPNIPFRNYIFSPTFYPELVGLGICMWAIYTFAHESNPSYAAVAAILAIAGIVVFCLGLFRLHQKILDMLMVAIIAIVIGLLQLNYLPALCFWLLIFYRLMLVPKTSTISLIMLTIMMMGTSFLLSHNFLPTLELTDPQQSFLMYCSVGVTAVIFGFHLWQLLGQVQTYKTELELTQARVKRLGSMTNKLTRFMPPQVWQPIIRTNQSVNVSNQRKKLTILFSDIVGFTELSDELSSDHLADILNTYFNQMTLITQKYNATLDKFIGDGMLCFFGDKNSDGEKADAIKCANMALEMRQAMQVLRSQWRLLGFEGLYVRIGINTGYCHVGNFGSQERMTYTVVGRAANLASRLESAAQKNQILITESTHDLIAGQHNCVLVGNYQFKGFKTPLPIWELRNPQEKGTNSNWLDYEFSGFNLHINLNEIKNYDEKQIHKSLLEAIDQLETKMQPTQNKNSTQ